MVCSKHKQDFTFFCVQDGCLICTYCFALEHPGHKCISLEEAKAQKQQELHQFHEEVKSSLSDHKQGIADATEIGEQHKECVTNSEKKIKTFFTELRKWWTTQKNNASKS